MSRKNKTNVKVRDLDALIAVEQLAELDCKRFWAAVRYALRMRRANRKIQKANLSLESAVTL